MKRYLALVLAILMVVPMIFAGTSMETFATQSRSYNFVTSGYSATGNKVTDICAIALLQEGRKGSQFGYTEDWCADFVSDCAKIAGASKAIPANGYVPSLYNAVLNAGGKVVSKPQKGDLAIIDWDGKGNYNHVELVYKVSGSTVYTVGGNTGSSSYTTSKVTVRGGVSYTNSRFSKFIRPNYSGTSGGSSSTSTGLPMLQMGGSQNTTRRVKTLQRMLIAKGYSCGSCGADGDFGSGTKSGVVKFQKAKNLDPDGIVGDDTWKALLTACKIQTGSKGDLVKLAQQILISKGYSCGSCGADGDFGSGTKSAVIKFQKANNLSQDGIVGKDTWTKLLLAYFY